MTAEYITRLTKLKSLQIAVISLSDLTKKSESCKCNGNRPYYSLLSNDVSTQEELRKISSSVFSRARWLQFFSIEMSLDDFFRDIFVPYDCEFTVVQRAGDEVVLTEVYRQQTLQKHVVATWRNHQFLWTNSTMLIRRGDLQNVTVRVGVDIKGADKLNMGYENMADGNEFDIIMEIWKIIEHKTNIVSEYVTPECSRYHDSSNGRLNGIFDLLVSNRADVGLAKFELTVERGAAVNYVSVALKKEVRTYIKEHGAGGSHWEHIVSPFSPGFWFMVFLSLVVMTVFLSQTWRISVRFMNQENENYQLSNSWLYTFGAFCQQGNYTTPVASPIRTVYITAFLTYSVLFAAYSGVYISMLAVEHDSLPFTDFHGLLGTGIFRFGVISDSLYFKIFQDAEDPVYKEIYEKMLKPNEKSLPTSDSEGLNLLCEEGDFAFSTDVSSIEDHDLPCDILEVPGAHYFVPASFIIRKSSPYHRIFSHHLENLRRTGILQRIIKLETPLEGLDDELPELEATAEDTLTIFAILFGGIVLSVLCLVVEYVCSKSFLKL